VTEENIRCDSGAQTDRQTDRKFMEELFERKQSLLSDMKLLGLRRITFLLYFRNVPILKERFKIITGYNITPEKRKRVWKSDPS
jgi:hypothetical protein